MTQNGHVYAICCQPAVDDDVISGRNVKAIEGYIVVNFEVASSSSFQDFPKWLFCVGEVGDGSDSVSLTKKASHNYYLFGSYILYSTPACWMGHFWPVILFFSRGQSAEIVHQWIKESRKSGNHLDIISQNATIFTYSDHLSSVYLPRCVLWPNCAK